MLQKLNLDALKCCVFKKFFLVNHWHNIIVVADGYVFVTLIGA